ncbi:LOW QUALITY PROTEIN: apoptosis inhibitor 5-like [Dendronephthya gigantea]|uniref:LOW QUALITY PROTEIN: apoptosis inhibitor 5-like n=2 Tax=Dendronephthya gigantea TaxID=151771 RepID=UPI00106B15BD|nr:LOW QUALITY PROTEIN: apoptosis inhibitor 5-like [Dendronephthya gigantea]
MDGVEHLYKSFGVLADAKEKAGEFPEEYQTILNSSKGSNGEKRLGATFIPRFFKYFPDYQATALNCLLDLCEDEDTPIRRLAIKALPTLCYDTKDHLTKIADVLTQLLPTGNALELSTVRNALKEVIELDPKGAIIGIFSQINAGDDESREHAVNFLKENVLEIIPKVFDPNPDAVEALSEEIHKAMPDVTGDEFKVFISLLSKLKSYKHEHDQLVDLIAEQAELDSELQPSDAEALEKFVTCTRSAIPFFQKGASAENFFVYLLEKILPVVEDVCGGEESGDLKLDIYKMLAEICPHKISDENLHLSVEPIFNKLLLYMPLPVVTEDKSSEESAEPTEPQIVFSFVECLMYSFHQVARKYPEFLTAADAADRLRDFKLRLQYVGQRCQMYIKQIKMSLNEKSGKDNEYKVKALRTTTNIHTLVKDLFHSPPSYNNHVNLSWVDTKKNPTSSTTASNEKPEVKTDTVLDEKRKRAGITPITFDASSPPKKAAGEKKTKVEYYLPPGRRANASNGNVEGKSMPGQYNRGGYKSGGSRGRFGRGRSRGYNRRGWRW